MIPKHSKIKPPKSVPIPVTLIGGFSGSGRTSLPGLRSTLGTLPEGVYCAKGIICFEELPSHKNVLQMVGRRYTIEETGRWGSEIPRSEIVLIGARCGIESDALQCSFEKCIGTGDESKSLVLRLSKRLFNDGQTSCKGNNP